MVEERCEQKGTILGVLDEQPKCGIAGRTADMNALRQVRVFW